MGPEVDNEKKRLVSEPADSYGMNCQEALRIEWRLVPYKAQYFFFYGAIGSLLPFLSLYFKEFGLSLTQIGILFGMKPIVGTFAAPLWGAIADKFRIRKAVLLLAIGVEAAAFLIISALPTPKVSDTCPPGLPPGANASAMEAESIDGYEVDIRWIYAKKDVADLYIVLLVLVIIGEMFWSPVGALADAALLSVLDESEMHKYPRQRSWGALAMAIFQLGTGAALQSTIHYREICGLNIKLTNYKVIIYIFVGALAVTFIVSSMFKFRYDGKTETKEKSSEEKASEFVSGKELSSALSVIEKENGVEAIGAIRSHDVAKPRKAKFSLYKFMRLMCSVHYGSWLLCIAYMGFCNSIILGFLFLYLEELGGDNLLMGVAGGVASGTEFLFFYVSFWFIDKIGPINMLYVSLITYALRFTNYALMVNPWLVLPSEVLQGFTFATAWAAFVQHASDALPTAYLAAIFGTLHGIYYGLGQGAGFLTGGILVDAIGMKNTFAMLIGVTVAVAFLICLAQKLSVKPVYVFDYDEEKEEMVVKTD